MSRDRPACRYVKDMIARIEAVGGEVIRGRHNHFKVYYEGRWVGNLPGTPSDRRQELNDIARLRRNGLPIKKRGEQ